MFITVIILYIYIVLLKYIYKLLLCLLRLLPLLYLLLSSCAADLIVHLVN